MQTVLIQKSSLPDEGGHADTCFLQAHDIIIFMLAFILGGLMVKKFVKKREAYKPLPYTTTFTNTEDVKDPCEDCPRDAETLPVEGTVTVVAGDVIDATVGESAGNGFAERYQKYMEKSMALTKPPEPAAVTLVEEEQPAFVECSWVNPPHTGEGVFPLQLPKFEGNSRTPLAQQQFIVRNLPALEQMLMEGKTSSYIMSSFNVNWIPLAEVLVAHKLPTPQEIRRHCKLNKQTTIALKDLYALGEAVCWKNPFRYAHATTRAKLEYISVISMCKNGMSVNDIAKHVGCPVWKVYGFMEKNKIPTPTAVRSGHKQIRLTKKKKEWLANAQQSTNPSEN